jgi:hypothetical protein
MVDFAFEAEVIHWRGPAPFFFVPVPSIHRGAIQQLAKRVSYGWGMIPVNAVIAGVDFSTALFPKDEGYLLPLKATVRKQCAITAGDRIAVEMYIGVPKR